MTFFSTKLPLFVILLLSDESDQNTIQSEQNFHLSVSDVNLLSEIKQRLGFSPEAFILIELEKYQNFENPLR